MRKIDELRDTIQENFLVNTKLMIWKEYVRYMV